MIIQFDQTLTLQIQTNDFHRNSIAYIDKFRQRRSDISKRLAAFKYLINHISVHRILDSMAGVGFSSKVIRKYQNVTEHLVNDIDPRCVEVLKANFPNSQVSNLDVREMKFEDVDLILMEFESLTINQFSDWVPIFRNVSQHCRYFISADTMSYSIKFHRNAQALLPQYYTMLSKRFNEECGLNILQVAHYGNAALLLSSTNPIREKGLPIFTTGHGRVDIEFYERKGFFMEGG